MKKITLDLLILFLLVFILIYLWFSKGLMFAGGEEGIPFYDLNKTIQLISYTWQDTSAGYPNQLIQDRIPYFSLLKYIYSAGIPGFLVQALHFFIIMLVGSVSMYFLLRETVSEELNDKKNSLFSKVSLIGAIFYLLNPFSMVQIWGRGIYLQFFPFALFPLFLLMFILGLRHKNFIFGILGLLSSVFFAGSFGNPSYIFSLWFIIFIYLLFYIRRNFRKKEILFSVSYLLLMIVGWILVHMWWMLPFIKTSANQFASAISNWNENIGTLKGVSEDYKLPNIVRLIHNGYVIRDQQYGQSYLSLPFIIISWLIPITATLSLATFKRLKIFLFFASLFLISVFVCIGSNFPTGWLFIFIFKISPPFQAFRNPFEKFGLILTIAYAPFFAIGIGVISQKISRIFKNLISHYVILLVFMFLIFGIFLWPMWTGQFAGGIRINPWVKVPDYYRTLDSWLSEQKNDGRIIHLPINPGDGLKYSGWEYPYQGIEPGEYLFTRPSIGKNGQAFKPYYNILLQRFNKFSEKSYGSDPDFINSEFRSEELYQELAKLNVRYIILHKDIDPKLGEIGGFESVEKYLDGQKNIKKVNSFGKLDVYMVDFSEDIQLIYSPQIKIRYSKKDSTQYLVNIPEVERPIDLYFLENFDSNWEAYINNQKIEDHAKLFSYANKWKINNSSGLNIIVKYKPQDFVDEGMNITKNTVLILCIICLYYFFWKIWKLKKI